MGLLTGSGAAVASSSHYRPSRRCSRTAHAGSVAVNEDSSKRKESKVKSKQRSRGGNVDNLKGDVAKLQERQTRRQKSMVGAHLKELKNLLGEAQEAAATHEEAASVAKLRLKEAKERQLQAEKKAQDLVQDVANAHIAKQKVLLQTAKLASEDPGEVDAARLNIIRNLEAEVRRLQSSQEKNHSAATAAVAPPAAPTRSKVVEEDWDEVWQREEELAEELDKARQLTEELESARVESKRIEHVEATLKESSAQLRAAESALAESKAKLRRKEEEVAKAVEVQEQLLKMEAQVLGLRSANQRAVLAERDMAEVELRLAAAEERLRAAGLDVNGDTSPTTVEEQTQEVEENQLKQEEKVTDVSESQQVANDSSKHQLTEKAEVDEEARQQASDQTHGRTKALLQMKLLEETQNEAALQPDEVSPTGHQSEHLVQKEEPRAPAEQRGLSGLAEKADDAPLEPLDLQVTSEASQDGRKDRADPECDEVEAPPLPYVGVEDFPAGPAPRDKAAPERLAASDASSRGPAPQLMVAYSLTEEEATELEELKLKIKARKEQLVKEFPKRKQSSEAKTAANKDPKVVAWVARLKELKQKEDSLAEPEPSSEAIDKEEARKQAEAAAFEKELENKKLQLSEMRSTLVEKCGYTDEQADADPDIVALRQEVQLLEGRPSGDTLRPEPWHRPYKTKKESEKAWFHRKLDRRKGKMKAHFENDDRGKSTKERKRRQQDFIKAKKKRLVTMSKRRQESGQAVSQAMERVGGGGGGGNESLETGTCSALD